MASLLLEPAVTLSCDDMTTDTMTLADRCLHCCAMFHELRKLQKEELLCDVNVKTGNRRRSVKAHRVVLMSRKSFDSDYQSDMDSDSDDDTLPTMSCSDESVFEEAYASDEEVEQATEQMEHINSLRRRGECCDVTLQAKDTHFKAHRCVLAAASGYFKSMFTLRMKERDMQYIQLNLDHLQVTRSHFESVLEYIYSGVITLDEEDIMPILRLSDFFQIGTLLKDCQSYLISQTSKINCCACYVLSKCFALEDLKSESRHVIHDYFPELDDVADDINHLKTADLLDVLESDDLGRLCIPAKRKESLVLERLMNWLLSARFADAADLLRLIRFPLVAKKDIEHHHKNMESIIERLASIEGFQCAQKFLDEALKYHDKIYEQPLLQTSNSQLRVSDDTLVCVDGVLAPEAVKLPSMCQHAKSPLAEQRGGISEKIRDPFHSVVVLNGFVYVLGGTRQTSVGYSTEVLRYDSRLDTWIKVAPMNVERSDFLACTVGDFIYVFGGKNKRGPTTSCERYNLRRNKWEMIEDLPEPLYMTAGVVHDGKVYLCGGFNHYDAVGTTLKYDPETNQWDELPAGMMCKDRGYHVLLNDGRGYLWAIGGVDNPFAGRNVWYVERFNLKTEMWEYVGQVLAVQPFLSVQRLNAFFDKDGNICVFAVTNIDRSPMLRFDIERNMWEELKKPVDYLEIGLAES